jgi:hypothetical protein
MSPAFSLDRTASLSILSRIVYGEIQRHRFSEQTFAHHLPFSKSRKVAVLRIAGEPHEYLVRITNSRRVFDVRDLYK